MREARRVDPYFGPSWYWPTLGVAQFVLRRYVEALADFDRGAPGAPTRLQLWRGAARSWALSNALGRSWWRTAFRFQPEATVGNVVAGIVFKEAGDREHLVECLRLAGMPE